MAGRADRILVNGLSSLGRMGVGVFLGLATTRAALHALAPDAVGARPLFGVFALLVTVSSASSFLNESVRQALVRYLALIPTEDKAATRNMMSAGFAWAATTGVTVSAVIVIAAPWLVSLLTLPEALTSEAVQCVRIFGVAHGLNALAIPWLAALRSKERFTLENLILVGQQAGTLLAVMVLAVFSPQSLQALAFAYTAPPIAAAWILATATAVRDEGCRVRASLMSKDSARGVLTLSGWSALISAATSLYERTDQILINVLLGPTFNAYYAVLAQLQSYVSTLVGLVNGVLLPTATRLTVVGTEWERQQLLLRSTRYSLLIAIPAVSTLIAVRRPLIHAWLGPGFDAAADVLPLGMLLVLLRAPNAVTWPYLTAANRLQWPALVLLTDGLTNVLLSIFYVRFLKLGLSGVLLGTLSTSTLRFVFFQGPYTARLTGMSAFRYWRESMGRPAIGLLLFAPTVFVITQLDMGPFGTVLLIALAVCTYAAGVWRWIFDPFERGLAERSFARIRAGAFQ